MIALAFALFAGWLVGYKRSVRNEKIADLTAERKKEVAHAKANEAKILSQPSPDNWADTVDKL
jgi:hypothetical protein